MLWKGMYIAQCDSPASPFFKGPNQFASICESSSRPSNSRTQTDYAVAYLDQQYSQTLQFGFDDALQGNFRYMTAGEHMNFSIMCTYALLAPFCMCRL